LQVHDELVYSVPEQHAELLKQYLHRAMTTEPKWAPGLPLATDVHAGYTYGDVK
jgi:DNA polymerase I-like protein with 3'-5' exonuclease and polymerase domains